MYESEPRIARAVHSDDQAIQLAPALRDLLERGLGADLSALRIHTGPEASALAAALDADAFTVGADVFFRHGACNPGTAAGRFLLAHEAAHSVQQVLAPRRGGTGGVHVSQPGDPAERAADRAAHEALQGRVANWGAPRVHVRRLREAEPIVLQRHSSWEHRLLGDAPSADLDTIARQPGANRTLLLGALRDFLLMWRTRPEGITEESIRSGVGGDVGYNPANPPDFNRYAYIRTIRLKTSGLLVTYGELNTLPDYLASAAAMDDLPKNILLPILQAVRQEGYFNVQRLLGVNVGDIKFDGAVATHLTNGTLNDIWESIWLNDLTANLPPAGSARQGTDSYSGLLARNACHFAPYSWYRWEQSYNTALKKAQEHHATGSPAAAREAWIHHGYADHFLQDSFAAGHLINKTLVMQWFVEWAAPMRYERVPDWEQVKTITAARQPGLAARGLYTPATPGAVRDPQTAEEQASRRQRMAMSGVGADGSIFQEAAYQNYLTFLNNSVIQSSPLALHDYLNGRGLWVASQDQQTPFELFGDNTMLNGGEGVQIASETAHMSQQSLQDVLLNGTTKITSEHIRSRFPTSARAETGVMLPLEQWNESMKSRAHTVFDSVHDKVIGALKPNMGHVSMDQGGTFRMKLTARGRQGYLGWTSPGWGWFVDQGAATKLRVVYDNGIFFVADGGWEYPWLSVGTNSPNTDYVGYYYTHNRGPWEYNPATRRLKSGVNGAVLSMKPGDSYIYCKPEYEAVDVEFEQVEGG